MKKLYKDELINLENITMINNKTSEVIEIKNSAIIRRTLTGKSTVSSNKYIYLDQDRLDAIHAKGIKLNELGFLILMCKDLMFNYNISMYDQKNPHSAKSLGLQLKITEQSASRILRKLIELGVVSKGKIKEMKHLGVVYTLNPYFLRVGKNFSSSIDVLFDDVIVKQ